MPKFRSNVVQRGDKMLEMTLFITIFFALETDRMPLNISGILD